MISTIVAAVVVVVILSTGSTADEPADEPAIEPAENALTDPQDIPAEAIVSTFGAKMKSTNMEGAEDLKVYTWEYDY